MDNVEKAQFSLILVDDEPAMLGSLKRVFRKAPYKIHTAENGLVAMDLMREFKIDAALVDLKMPGMGGLELLEQIRKQWPWIQVVILTGFGGVKEAVEAIQMGAVDFLQKPFEAETIEARMNQIFHIWSLEQENKRLREKIQFQFGYDQLIGNSTAMLKLKKMIMQVAGSDASVLIQGETGTGKELVARVAAIPSSLWIAPASARR
jgi:DNA-binding NtrC family response regulator